MLATLEALKRYIGMNQIYREEDNCLEACLDLASGRIERICGRSFDLMETTDYLDGVGTSELVLSRRPVTELYAVWLDASREFGGEARLHRSEFAFYPATGIVKRTSGTFQRGARNIKVSYAAGYKTIPEDLALACVQLAAQLYLVSSLSAETEALVAPYKNRVPK